MWRVQGLVGRVLHRYHGSNSLRLPPNPHVEDEVINSSAALSTSRHPLDSRSQEDDGDRRSKQKTFQFGSRKLPHYTALDAVGWGAAALLFMQVCRRIHSKFSSGTEPSSNSETLTSPSAVQKCGYRILLEILSRRDVLPRGRHLLCLQAVQEKQSQDQPASESSSSSEQQHPADGSVPDHQGELLYEGSPTPEESLLFESCPLQYNTNQSNNDQKEASEERLTEAALNLRDVGDNSVPVILNIIGLENDKSENYEEAFTCFLAAAQQGYSKAQFNTGVCYEKGRGVRKDRDKALFYYKLAAVGGHKQAQYRYAKLLLTSRGQQSLEELNTAISLLEKAATAGLSKAQVCLASFYSRDPGRYGCKFVEYLQMAAESEDDTALFLLGQCYETGFGLQQNFRMAVEFYRRSAQAGNKQARNLLTPVDVTHYKAEDAVLRSIRSAPCFTVAETLLQNPLSSLKLPLLPHSWSTGNLSLSAPLHHSGADGGACQWTVGVG